MDQTASSSVVGAPVDVAARVRGIRARLPGQMLRERIEIANVSYGPLYTMADARQKVAETLPRRLGFVRGATLELIEAYREPIPDDALLKYDDAVRSGLFARFLVATPTYYEQRQIDPWILGEVAGTEFCAVITQW